MPETTIVLPSKPQVIKENETHGQYEIEGLYPGYGHTLGNSLRRIILSSLPGVAITAIKIDGVAHEFSTIKGVKEDVISLLLNLKKVHFSISGDEAQTVTIKAKGPHTVTAADLKLPGQVTLTNKDQYICTLADKDSELDLELTLEHGIGYIPKESLQRDRVEIGTITLDAAFSPILNANYDVEQMRVGDRTDYNRLRISIQTDGTITPRAALEKSIEIMITQLKAIIGFKEDQEIVSKSQPQESDIASNEADEEDKDALDDILKTRTESLDLSQRTVNALVAANIRTVGGLIRKKEDDILEIDGMGSKGLEEIKKVIEGLGLSLKA